MTETVLPDVLSEVRGQVGFITLNRPRALNALSLGMVRDLMGILLAWQVDARVLAVAIRGSNKEGPFGAFCAGGDIRFLHQAGSQGNPLIEDFFTEEYALNHLIHNYAKPCQENAKDHLQQAQQCHLGSLEHAPTAHRPNARDGQQKQTKKNQKE